MSKIKEVHWTDLDILAKLDRLHSELCDFRESFVEIPVYEALARRVDTLENKINKKDILINDLKNKLNDIATTIGVDGDTSDDDDDDDDDDDYDDDSDRYTIYCDPIKSSTKKKKYPRLYYANHIWSMTLENAKQYLSKDAAEEALLEEENIVPPMGYKNPEILKVVG